MALVKIACTCARCGKPFTHLHTCRNSADAASYEAWARDNITICPECLAREKSDRQAEAYQQYVASFGPEAQLPEISGVSPKQIAYAASLRQRFIAEELLRYQVDVNRFLRISRALRLENCGEDGRKALQAAAEKAGQPLEAWFESYYRPERLRRDCRLARAEDAAKIELIFTEANASKIIDALR